MANEITVSCSVSFSKGGSANSLGVSGLQFDMAGSRFTRIRQNIGITEEVLSVGDVGTKGFLIVINRDLANYVTIRQGLVATYVNGLVKVKKGEPAMFRVDPAATLYGTANTAACDVEFLLIED